MDAFQQALLSDPDANIVAAKALLLALMLLSARMDL